jgi:16S rRNA processing protein RimM
VSDPTERLELLDAGRSVLVGDRDMCILARRGTPRRPIVVVEGVGDRTAAESLRGEAITVPRTVLGTLDENEFLVDDLVGCEVVDGERPVGRVLDVLLLPSADTLEVERPNGEPLLVPLVGDAVRSVDTAGARIDVDLGFLE